MGLPVAKCWEDLPDDLWGQIFGCMADVADAAVCSQVCKHWRTIFNAAMHTVRLEEGRWAEHRPFLRALRRLSGVTSVHIPRHSLQLDDSADPESLTLPWRDTCACDSVLLCLASHSHSLTNLHLDFHQRPDFGSASLQRLLEGCPLLRCLSLGNRQLASLPAALPPLPHLTVLSLNMPHLSSLPPSLPSLPALRTLSLTNCEHMDTIGPSLTHYPLITKLELHSIGPTIPKDLFLLTHLTSLLLHDAWLLPHIPHQDFAHLSALTTLHIHEFHHPWCVRDVDFGGLMHLKEVELRHVAVRDLSPLLSPSLGLLSLSLLDCALVTEMPSCLGRLTSLRRLHLHFPMGRTGSNGPRLTQLSSMLTGLRALEDLSLSYCQLRSLPPLPALRQLRLVEAMDGPASIAASLGELRSMEHLIDLELQAEQLVQLPLHFPTVRLLSFRLINASFPTLPYNLSRMPCLRHLTLCGGRLVELPASLGEMAELRSLRLEELSHLRSLPGSIGDLPRLSTLEILHCFSLRRLPASMGGMRALRTLKVYTCAVRTIGGLPQLTSLTLVDCWALKSLPASLESLTSLRHLELHGLKSLERLPALPHCLHGVRRVKVADCGSSNSRRRGRWKGYLRKFVTQLVDIVQPRGDAV